MAPRRPKNFNYQRYLASREWGLLKEQVRERCEGECEHCRLDAYEETHHLTYERIGHEELPDLMAVCRDCHAWLSGKSDWNPFAVHWVASARLEVTDRGSFHFLIPVLLPADELPLKVRTARCRGEGCIWCGYIIEHWPIYLSFLHLTTEIKDQMREAEIAATS